MLGGDWTDGTMTDFKWRHFQGDVILWAVRWYCRYPISYRDLEEMLAERGISVDHTTIYRWVQCYAPEMEKRLRWFWRRGFDPSWRLDETYVKVRGKWTYLYRAVDKRGDTIDFYLSPTRSAKAAKRFLGKALRSEERRAGKGWDSTGSSLVTGVQTCSLPISFRSTIRRSIAGSSATPRRWRSGCAGSGGVALIRAGAWMKPTSRCGASGPTCTGQSTSGATRSISTCRRPAAPRQRSGSWARPCEA